MKKNLPVTIRIPFEPVAAVRPKVTKWNTYYPGKYGKYLPEVRDWLNVHWRLALPRETLLDVTAYFGLSRPKSHYGTGRNSLRVKASAARVPHQDVDNLAKGVLDACNGVVWEDDSAVVRLVAEKGYGSGESVLVVSEFVTGERSSISSG